MSPPEVAWQPEPQASPGPVVADWSCTTSWNVLLAFSAHALVVASLLWLTSPPPDPNPRNEKATLRFRCSVVASAFEDWLVEFSFEPFWDCQMSPPSSHPQPCPDAPSDSAHWPWTMPCVVSFELPATAPVWASFDWSTSPLFEPKLRIEIGALRLSCEVDASAFASCSVEFSLEPSWLCEMSPPPESPHGSHGEPEPEVAA
jgi:hypothetical protein